MSKLVPTVLSALPWHNTIVRTTAGGGLSPAAFSVMNFNLLANCYSPEHTEKVIKYDERKSLNMKHVAAVRPHLLVTEETDEDYFGSLEEIGYDKAAAFKKEGPGAYTCVFILKDSPVKKLDYERFDVDPTGERGQFAFVMRLSFEQQLLGGLAPPFEFCLVAMHAKAGRADDREAFRMSDVNNLAQKCIPEYLKSKNSMHLMNRLLWVGDLNAGPTSYGDKYPCRLIPWMLGAADNKAEFPNFPVKLTSSFHNLHGEHPNFTTCKHREEKIIEQCIDYILIGSELGECTGTLASPSKNPTVDLMPTLLPCPGKWGSDHISAYSEIDIGKARVAAAAAQPQKQQQQQNSTTATTAASSSSSS